MRYVNVNEKIRDGLLCVVCFTLIFNNIPKNIQMNFWGGTNW